MKFLTARSRITIGLAGLLVSIICGAIMIGIVPERDSAVRAGRANLCETIAMSSSDYISRGELSRLAHLIKSIVERNDDVLSAGVRKANGDLVTDIGNHAAGWPRQATERSTGTHINVPIRSGQKKWGSVELRFRALQKPGLVGYWENPWLQMTIFVVGVSYIVFFVYLGKMLQHLDPSKTVPKRVRSALDSLAEGLLVIDKDQRIVLANQSFATWIGRPAEKLVGVHAAKLDWVKNQQNDPLEEYPWVEALRLQAPQVGVMLGLAHQNEPTQILMANASPVLGHDGKYRGVLVSFDDVTQLEETKRDLKVAKKVAENANQAKSEFLARMSHEIRTPMNAILGYTDVLRRGFDESVENRHEYLDTIHASGEHLLALINDILDLSKVEAGQMELELEPCSPHKLISQVVRLLRPKADEKGISLEIRWDGLLPETILVDSVRLRQTIMNLVGNAIKFTETGGVTIAPRLAAQASNLPGRKDARPKNTQLAIDVIDTGIGIAEAAQKKIFEPFAQADATVTRKFGGTGLGLAISKQLAEAMGGGIEITSQEGKGSTFTVTVDVGPLDGIKMVDGKAALAAETHEISESKDLIQLPPARILVADDGETNRKLVELVLGRAGLDVVSVENGKLAVDRALRNPFDVILMDMHMPVMDGYTAATTLREAGYEAPIIALTANAMRGDEEKCRAAGCSGFLTKPIEIDVLLATLSEALGASSPPTSRDEYSAVGRVVRSVSAGSKDHHDTYDGPKSPSMESFGDPFCGTDDDCQQVEQTLTDLAETSHQVSRPDSSRSHQAFSFSTEERLPTSAADPIRCSFPMDDPDFVEIAKEFVERLDEKLKAMEQAWLVHNYDELAALAHWLKGCGGTAGFDAFTPTAKALERLAGQHNENLTRAAIVDLRHLADRILIPATA